MSHGLYGSSDEMLTACKITETYIFYSILDCLHKLHIRTYQFTLYISQ